MNHGPKVLAQLAQGQYEGTQFPIMLQILVALQQLVSGVQSRQGRREEQVADRTNFLMQANGESRGMAPGEPVEFLPGTACPTCMKDGSSSSQCPTTAYES